MDNRIGETNINNQGCEMMIIEYNNSTDIIIEFQDKYKTRVKSAYKEFKNGVIKNPYYPAVYGKGFLGIGEYSCITHMNIYKDWSGILQRCYDEKYHKKYPSYIDCEVEEELLCFQNFAQWWEDNYYEIGNERMELDKDILVKNNKIYSKETCIFVPQRINSLFTKRQNDRGEYPIGVCYSKKDDRLIVRCSVDGKRVYLGNFLPNQINEAFICYKTFKENYIKQVADEYKNLIPQKLYEAMYKWEVEIND